VKRGPLFWVTAAIGWAFIGWGLRGVAQHHVDTRPAELARFFVGGAVVHDLLFVPLVLIVGVVAARLVPVTWRSFVQAAFVISGIVVLVAYPEIRDYARILHNPTSLPHNYTANVVIVVAAVWVVTGVAALARRRLKTPRPPRSSGG
jgi:hypothetical protein